MDTAEKKGQQQCATIQIVENVRNISNWGWAKMSISSLQFNFPQTKSQISARTPHNCRMHSEEEPQLNSQDQKEICFFVKETTDAANKAGNKN